MMPFAELGECDRVNFPSLIQASFESSISVISLNFHKYI